MKKENLITLLESQRVMTKKNTRKDIVAFVRDMVEYHIKDGAEISGISPNRSGTGVILGDVVEVIAKSLFRNKLNKTASDKHYDLLAKGEKVEVKFATSDAYAHEINPTEVVDYYLIITYSKRLGLNAFKVPYACRNEIDVCHTWDKSKGRYTDRPTINQKAKFLDKELTKRLFAF